MSKKHKSRIATFLLCLQVIFSLFLPLQPLASQAFAQETSAVSFVKSGNNIVVNDPSAKEYQYFFETDRAIQASAGAIVNGTFNIKLKSQSGEDAINFDINRLVLKTDASSYYLEIAENDIVQAKEYNSNSFDLSIADEEFLINSWQVDNETKTATTIDKVVLNKTYSFPFNEAVKVIFSKLPSESSTLTISEIALSAEQQAQLGSGPVAYDVTTEMKDGEFAFDLQLPATDVDENSTVKYAENLAGLNNAQIANNELEISDGKVLVKNLDHMTIFVVVSANEIQSDITDLTLNDSEAAYFGAWSVGSSSCAVNAINADGHYASNSETKTATWSFNVPTDGQYLIKAYWVTYTTQASNALYQVFDDDDSEIFSTRINQRSSSNCLASNTIINSGSPVSLEKGRTYRVVLSNSGADGNVYADAVQILSTDFEVVRDISFTSPSNNSIFGDVSNIDFEISAEYLPYDISRIMLRYAPEGETCQEQYTSPYYNEIGNASRDSSDSSKFTKSWDISSVDSGNYTVCALMHRDSGLGSEGFKTYNLASVNVTIDKDAPDAPELVSPDNGDFVNGNPTQTWTSITDAVKYLYESAYDYDFTSPIYSTPVTTNYRTVGGLQTISFWWRVKAVDAAGNESAWSDPWKLNVDNTAPEKVTLVSPSNNSFVNGNVLLSDWDSVSDAVKYIYESYHDSSATHLRYQHEYAESEKTAYNVADSEFWWRVRAVDAAGNLGPWSDLWHVTVDNTSPTDPIISGFKNPNLSCNSFTNQRIVTVDWTDSFDVSGIDGYNYRIDYPTTNGGRGIWAPFFDTTTSEYSGSLNEGIHYITVQAKDLAGNLSNWSNTCSITYDPTPPTSTISVPTDASSPFVTNNWDGKVAGTASDSLSGIDRVELEIDHSLSGSVLATASGSLDGSGQYNWEYTLPTEPEEGTYTITSHAVDNAGNRESSYTIVVILDKTIPTVGISLNPASPDGKNGWYETQPEVTLTATDDIDLDRIEYQWDGKVDGAWTSSPSPAVFKLATEGHHILYYRAIDKAGNGYDDKDIGIRNIMWDKTELTEGPLNVDATPDRSGGPDAKVVWEAASDNVGIDHYKVTFDLLDGDADFSEDVASHIREFETSRLTEAGTWKVTVTAYDGAGHEKSASDEIIVDKEAPAAPTLSLTGTGAGSVDLSWTKVDDADEYIILYGVNDGQYIYAARVGNVLSYTVQGLTAGNYYFVVRAEDEAGNQSANSNQVSTLSLVAAPGGGNVVAQGFEEAPEVLGVNTETEQNTGENLENAGEVLGVTSCNPWLNSLWWILLVVQFVGLMMMEYFLGRKYRWLKWVIYLILGSASVLGVHYLVDKNCLESSFSTWLVSYYYLPVLANLMLIKIFSYLLIEGDQ